MKINDLLLLEYKNKYYKPVPKKPKPRKKSTLWYNKYENWVADIKTRFPDAQAFYDEENEEVVATCKDCKDCYGKWSNNKKDYQGVSFHKSRNLANVTHNGHQLKQLEDPKK